MNWRRFTVVVTLAMVAPGGSPTVGAQAGFTPARYVGGAVPVAPVLAVSGGEVFLEVMVAPDGRVASIRTLRQTPPFTGVVIDAVRGWRFTPATEVVEPAPGQTGPQTRTVAAPVLVAAMFAPPALNGPTLGQPPQDALSASDETPMPTVATPAGYPPRALGDGTVLVEVTIDGAGNLAGAQLKVSAPGFDAAAMAAATSWSFRAARKRGSAVTTHAYLIFGFRPPVVGLP